MRRTHSLIHRGYLYAQKRVTPETIANLDGVSGLRMKLAEAWRQGNLQARRDAKKTKA